MAQAVHAVGARLAAAGIASSRADAVALLAHVLSVEPGEVERQVVLRSGTLPPQARHRLVALVDERARRVPLQHLTGRAHFRHLTLRVGPGVFVPRPETEVLVDLALSYLRRREAVVGAEPVAGSRAERDAASSTPPVVVDLCTGSGAIAFALASEWPSARVHAAELDPAAAAWAERNGRELGLDVNLRSMDAAEAFPQLAGRVDLVTCNPPYIPADAVPLDPEVADHDPELALYGGPGDGLGVPRVMALAAARLLRPGGLLLMEHADSQGESILAMFDGITAAEVAGEDDRPASGGGRPAFVEVLDHPDLTGRPRVAAALRG
ncbi:peptide chain release factor N(5)-glutamine methyltransferase [Agilicoccus flavus]|uniref:peptide chain release factor N(5)-glutamine methyltransferase n=1 Tax=Agilicoccus flavus TaxID=2775968 RepID=UPI001CF62DB8|nr:peptide chain release factor N(5)-glutamine methyltransferase [Agilicoccus flavus]